MKRLLVVITVLACFSATTAFAETGFYRNPAYSDLGVVVEAGPADGIGSSNGLTRHGVGLLDGHWDEQFVFGAAIHLLFLNAVRVGVGWGSEDVYGRISDGIEFELSAGWSFDKLDFGATGRYLRNSRRSCELSYGEMPDAYAFSGFAAYRLDQLTVEMSGGIDLYTTTYDCAYEGGGWGLIFGQPRVAWQFNNAFAIAFQTAVFTGKEFAIRPKLEAVYSIPIGVGVVDLSASFESLTIDEWSNVAMVGVSYRL